jgi:hypothetical protein
MVPPSVHPNGDVLVWREESEPASITSRDLLVRVEGLAAHVLLAKHWSGNGARHGFALALAGLLLEGGMSPETASGVVECCARVAGDEEVADRVRAVETTASKIVGGQPVRGRSGLEAILGQRVVAKVEEWLHLERCGGLRAGRTENGNHRAPKPVSRSIADVPVEEVRWLWKPYIPIGKLTLLAGNPQVGKSFTTLDIAARVSRGEAMPLDSGGVVDPGAVLILSSEDGVGDTIRPRLEAADADVGRVRILEGKRTDEGVRAVTLQDLEVLEEEISQHRPRLIIVDPLAAYLGQGVDAHRSNETRPVMAGCAQLAARHGVAIVVVAHMNKSTGGDGPALYRIAGSIDFVAAARSALMAVEDPFAPGQRLLCHLKSNLAPAGPSLVYRIEQGRVRWLGTDTRTADDVLRPAVHGRGFALEEAAAFIRTRLAGGHLPKALVAGEALAAGISGATLRRAARQLGVVKHKLGKPGEEGAHWTWELPKEQGE